MKSLLQVIFPLFFCILVVFLSGCEKASLTEVLPVERTLVDLENRELPVSIEGKSSTKIAFRRKSDQKLFVLPIEKLDSANRAFVEKLPNSPDFSSFEKEEKETIKKIKMQGRTASWHRSLPNALREAAQYDIPVLVTFLDSEDSQNQNFSQKVLESKTFRDWANSNVVLCLFYNTPANVGLNGAGSQEVRELATTLGVSATPGIAILDSKGNGINKLNPNPSITPDALVRSINSAISSPKTTRPAKRVEK